MQLIIGLHIDYQ
jgi:hypothetical protein